LRVEGSVAAVRLCIEVGSGLRTDLGVVRQLGWHAVPTLPDTRARPIRYKWTRVSRRTERAENSETREVRMSLGERTRRSRVPTRGSTNQDPQPDTRNPRAASLPEAGDEAECPS